jgi:hypothetical protein
MQKCRNQDKFLSALPRPPAGPYAVEKLLFGKMLKNFALRCPINDDLNFLDISYPQILVRFARNRTFSTDTPVCINRVIDASFLEGLVHGVYTHSNHSNSSAHPCVVQST